MAEKIVIAFGFPLATSGANTEEGMSPSYEFPALTRAVFIGSGSDSGHSISGLSRFDRQGKSDITRAQDSNMRLLRSDFSGKRSFKRAHCGHCNNVQASYSC